MDGGRHFGFSLHRPWMGLLWVTRSLHASAFSILPTPPYDIFTIY